MAWTEKTRGGKYVGRYYAPDGTKMTAEGGPFGRVKAARDAAIVEERESKAPGWRDPRRAKITWGEWCERWWRSRQVEPGTLRKDASPRDRHLMPQWADAPLVEITRMDVKLWVSDMLAAGLAPSSVKRHVALFSASLTGAIDDEILERNVALRIPILDGERDTERYLTRREASELMQQFAPPFFSPAYEAFAWTLLGTGARFGEASGLLVPRVNLARQTIRIAETWDTANNRPKAYPKGKKQRTVPIPDWLTPYLERMLWRRDEGFVFDLGTGKPFHYSNWYNRIWVPARNCADLPDVRPHDLRHTFASWHLQSGTPLARVGQLLGHTTARATSIYAHLADNDVVNPSERIDGPAGHLQGKAA